MPEKHVPAGQAQVKIWWLLAGEQPHAPMAQEFGKSLADWQQDDVATVPPEPVQPNWAADGCGAGARLGVVVDAWVWDWAGVDVAGDWLFVAAGALELSMYSRYPSAAAAIATKTAAMAIFILVIILTNYRTVFIKSRLREKSSGKTVISHFCWKGLILKNLTITPKMK
jgi:hypothetical protein